MLARLQENLQDSKARSQAMIAESSAIHRQFQANGLSYAVLKGFSLWPVSVPKLELRSQLDLDYLIAAEDVACAKSLLEARGYELRAVSGRSWEFKSNEPGCSTLKDIYKPLPQRCAELHVEAICTREQSLLARTETRRLHGLAVPVLSQVDLYLGQGLHLYKHVCSEFFRAAHLLEFYRHTLVRYHDDTFWEELRTLAEQKPGACAALGVINLLLAEVMGDFAPKALSCWSSDRVPDGARVWVSHYGRHCVLRNHPGDKLYLLLAQEMRVSGAPLKRSSWQALIPRRLPPAVYRAALGETLASKLKRWSREAAFRGSRLRFHATAGTRYAWEAARWKRRVAIAERAYAPVKPPLAPLLKGRS